LTPISQVRKNEGASSPSKSFAEKSQASALAAGSKLHSMKGSVRQMQAQNEQERVVKAGSVVSMFNTKNTQGTQDDGKPMEYYEHRR
jgi:hypothetical protein